MLASLSAVELLRGRVTTIVQVNDPVRTLVHHGHAKDVDLVMVDGRTVDAGTGSRGGGFSGAPVEDWRRLVEVNVLGAAYTLRASLEAIKKSRGHVLTAGSVAARRVIAGSMYSATEWAVSAIGYGLREELWGTGVRVTLIEPGMVDTPFFDDPQPDALREEDVVRAVLYALEQPPSVDVHELVVLPTPPLES